MKLLALALLGCLALARAAADDPTVSLPGVTDLTPDNFASEHNGKRAALIEFYAPWCGHCKRLVPEYTKLGEKIAADPKLKNRVLIAKVDADAHRELGEKFGVRGFPTLKWFPRGKADKPEDYNGGRSVGDFLKFINDKIAADAGFARVDALVPLAAKFHRAAADARAAILTAAEAAAETVSADDKDNAALYLRFMKKALEKGEAYLEGELARLNKMAEKAMSAAKLDEVSRKVSVLTSFVEEPPKEAAPATPTEDEDDADEGEEVEEEEAAAEEDDEVYDDGLCPPTALAFRSVLLCFSLAPVSRATVPCRSICVTFKNIGFSVKDRRTGATVQILKGIDGRIEPKRLMVIMGSSGAGKTTLLDVLACNMFGSGTVSGEVLVNGAPRNRREFSQISCYVMQRDVLLASSTVREALLIAALLKLPRSMPTAEKVAQVDAVLADLELERCQHTLIGDEVLGMKGISGGQRRRVSVGVELVKNPRVLFMDEPTSGLDSEMAVSLVDTLVRLARQNRTVCTTIHQPNSYITSKFDDLMLLHAGAVAYAGPWSDSVSYFASQGCPCPQYTNPTDFYMATLKEKGDELTAAWAKQGHGLNGLAALEAGEASAVVAGEGEDGGRVLEEPALELQTAPRASWPYQVYVLGGRMLRMWWRNPAMLVSESAQYAFMAVFVGLVYLQVSDSVATGINDRAASMWLAMAILSFTPSYTSVVIWDKDRLLLRRETQQGMYNVTAWFAAKTVTTWPVEILQTTLFCVVAYWMVGYAPSAAAFFIFVAAFCMFQLTSETVGTICAIICGNATYSILLLTFVLLFLLSFSGFLVSAVPVYFRWIAKISYLTYAYAAVVQNEFTRIDLTTESGETVSGAAVYDGTWGGSLLGPTNNGLSIAANVGVLLAITVGTRALAFALLFVLHKLKRL